MQTENVRICANTKRPCTHTEPCNNAPNLVKLPLLPLQHVGHATRPAAAAPAGSSAPGGLAR